MSSYVMRSVWHQALFSHTYMSPTTVLLGFGDGVIQLLDIRKPSMP